LDLLPHGLLEASATRAPFPRRFAQPLPSLSQLTFSAMYREPFLVSYQISVSRIPKQQTPNKKKDNKYRTT
jgi:hypothetical protein